MNSNQRVHAVLNGELPDGNPVREFAVDFDTVEKILGHETYLRAKARSQIAFWEGRHMKLLDMFIEIGYDAYQSIQPTAAMDICEVKQKYGDKIVLWGGVAVENLMGGTPEDIRADVRRAMACAKPGGGFILGSSHSIAVGSHYDNYMAMLDEYHKHCNY